MHPFAFTLKASERKLFDDTAFIFDDFLPLILEKDFCKSEHHPLYLEDLYPESFSLTSMRN